MSARITLAALQAARKGWRVYPLRPRSKRPYFSRWRELATTDPATIALWFGEVYRDAGLGAIPPTHVVRLDADVKGNGERTLDYWRTSEAGLPDTLTSRTPSGGRHLYFLTEAPLSSSVRLAAGVEYKVGSVILPPSPGYCWVGNGDQRIARLPDWLELLATEAESRDRADRKRAGFALKGSTISDLAWKIEAWSGQAPLVKRDGFLSFRCPAHDDGHPSGWAVETPGGLRLGCFAYCTAESIIEALEGRRAA